MIKKGRIMRGVLLLVGVIMFITGCRSNHQEKELQVWIDAHVSRIKTLEKETNLAYWEAAVTGSDSAYQRYAQYDLALKKIYQDPVAYERLKQFQASGKIADPLLSRQLDVLLKTFMAHQIDDSLLAQQVRLEQKITQAFSTFRGEIDGRPVTANEIEQILKTETDSFKRRKAWEASKQVGQVVASDLIALVRLRNEAARSLGFDNYHTLALTVNEQRVELLDSLLEDLAAKTEAPFKSVKYALDERLASLYDLHEKELMPWHYHDPFFQEAPLIESLDLDPYYRDRDLLQIATRFYEGIGLDVRDILARSDLFEKMGKNPHAFCTHIDREGDIRILCNLQSNERWMETLLHELGHAVYDRYLDPSLPYLLREPAHAFTTEAIAMLFGRQSHNADWMAPLLGLSEEDRLRIAEASRSIARMKQLIFVRWALVMYAFEKALYANPDQDLNTLWWDLVERYQLVRRPPARHAPDWASKIHIALYPCYYHNYLLGELLASQIHHTLSLQASPGVRAFLYADNPRIGKFLKEKIFGPGKRYPADEMIRLATGERFSTAYFLKEFVE